MKQKRKIYIKNKKNITIIKIQKKNSIFNNQSTKKKRSNLENRTKKIDLKEKK